jgi:polyvinyl alcohol dehydrogenase (cytochrome)
MDDDGVGPLSRTRWRVSPDRRRCMTGRLYVPTSSYEESQGADPQYACCTFRGSVTALDAATGAGRRGRPTCIGAEPQRRGTSTRGATVGPGWSARSGRRRRSTRRRGLVYVATGNLYSGPRSRGRMQSLRSI